MLVLTFIIFVFGLCFNPHQVQVLVMSLLVVNHLTRAILEIVYHFLFFLYNTYLINKF